MPSRDKPKLASSTPIAVWNEAPLTRDERSKRPSVWKGITSIPLNVWLKAVLPTAVVLAISPFLGIVFPALLLGTVSITLYQLWLYAQYFGSARPSSRVRNLMDRLGLQHGEPVGMFVIIDGHTTGLDQGVVVFEDRTLRFYGLRTTFRLSPNVVYAPADAFENGPFEAKKSLRRSMGDHSKGVARGFALRDHPGAFVWISSVRPEPEASTFSRSLYRWMTSPPVATDNSILPPLLPMAGRRPPKETWLSRRIGRRSK